jgi:hypothetical protein
MLSREQVEKAFRDVYLREFGEEPNLGFERDVTNAIMALLPDAEAPEREVKQLKRERDGWEETAKLYATNVECAKEYAHKYIDAEALGRAAREAVHSAIGDCSVYLGKPLVSYDKKTDAEIGNAILEALRKEAGDAG